MSVSRVLAGAAALPIGALGGGLHAWLSGPQAIIDVEVESFDDVVTRLGFYTRLRRASEDDTVAAVLLRIQAAPGGWAACQDLRSVISALRAAGRAVYAWLEAPTNQTMWIGAACDRIIVPPLAQVGLVGVGIELTFFGAALQRLGVSPDFEAAGEYKSFGEAYTRSFASPANQEAMSHLIADLHSQLLADVAKGRGIPVDRLEAAIAGAPLTTAEALEAGLVDQILYEDQLEDWLSEHHGSTSQRIPYGTWARRRGLLDWVGSWGAGGTVITVVHLEGPITMEQRNGSAPSIAARSVVPLLRELRKDDRVGAVVLHVNSPGGSAFASDLIWREVDQLKGAKPVVASFEDVAASGGYYVSAPAMEILARSTTLTGSIGVFGGKLVAGEGLRKLGVHNQEISAAPNANLFTPSRPFTDAQRLRFRESLEHLYREFVQRVADGRHRAEEVVEPHCRGRVWTGGAARERGLVDREGDLYDAVERARALAGLHPSSFVRRDVSPIRRSWLNRQLAQAMKDTLPAAASAGMQALVGGLTDPLLEMMATHQGEALAMLPFGIEVR